MGKQAIKDSHRQAPINRNKRIFMLEMPTFTNKKNTHNGEDKKYVIRRVQNACKIVLKVINVRCIMLCTVCSVGSKYNKIVTTVHSLRLQV